MRELECTSVLDSYACDGLAAGTATHVGQVWSDTRQRETPWSSKLGVGMQMTTSPHKNSVVLKPWQLGGHGPKMGQSLMH